MYNAIESHEDAILRAAHEDNIDAKLAEATAASAAAMADKVLVEAALAEIEEALATIQASRAAAVAA